MQWIDRHFMALSGDKKFFVLSISFGYLLVALIGYFADLITLMDSFLLFVVGMLYAEMIKLQFRVQDLETARIEKPVKPKK